MDSSLDELKSSPHVLDLYVARVRLKKESGTRYRGLCPFHDERTPSFDVFQHQGRWIHKCLGCGASGSVLDLVQKTDGVDFKEAVKIVREAGSGWYQDKARVESTFRPVGQDEKKFKTFSEADYTKLEDAFEHNPEARSWLVRERGIEYETARKLRIGFRQDVGKIAGESNSDIAARGWIAFPTFRGNEVTSVKYRSLARKSFCKQPGMATSLFNLQAVDPLMPVYVVEGELDCAALAQLGLNCVSLPNAQYNLTPEDKDALMEAECVVLAGDNDAPGSEKMNKLWNELGERTFYLKWPPGIKDANSFWDACKRSQSVFRTKIEELTQEAKSRPMTGIYNLAEVMQTSTLTSLADHPDRLRFPWHSVDTMANLLPGSICALFATSTGMGKTTFVMNALIHAAKQGETILNYSAELSCDEYANLVTAHLLRKNRNFLSPEDRKEAAKLLNGAKFYIGRNPDLTTIGPVLDLMEAGVRRLGATVAVLDHLHFLVRHESDTVKAQENAMQRLKNISVKYGIKIIVVGQPRKANAQSKGKLVSISDAKGSETFTSDADVAIAIHRDTAKNFDPQNPPKEPYESKTQIHLLKGRSQGTGNAYAELVFLGETATFSELAYESESSEGLFGK